MMRWKLRVRDFRGNIHVHRFLDAEAAYRHWTCYHNDGICERLEMWKLTKNLVATGETGEEVWIRVQTWPVED